MAELDSNPYPHPEADFKTGLATGRLLIQRCSESGHYLFYPRVISPWTGHPTLKWVEASGRATVYSTTIVRRRPDQGGDYNVSLVELAEGPRLMSRVVDIPPSEVKIGMSLRAEIRPLDGESGVVFVPAQLSTT